MPWTRPKELYVQILIATGIVLVVSGLAGAIQNGTNQQRLEASFQDKLDRVTREIEVRMDLYAHAVRSARGVVIGAGGAGIDRATFAEYMASRDLEREYPGARGLGFIRRVAAVDAAAFEEREHAEGRPEFKIWQMAPHDGERWVVQYEEPESQNAQALGLDFASDRIRRRAAQESMDLGIARLSAPLTLVQVAEQKRNGVVLLLPVYRSGQPTSTPEERRAATLGWTYAPLLIDDVLAGLTSIDGEVALQLTDSGTDGSTEPFFSTADPADQRIAGLAATRQISALGRDWGVRAFGLKPLVTVGHLFPPAAAAWLAGGMCTLLAIVVISSARARSRRRAERAREDALARGVVNAVSHAIVVVDEDGRIVEANRGATDVFGRAHADLVGRPVVDVVPSAHTDFHALLREGSHPEVRPPATRPEIFGRHADGHEFPIEITLGQLELAGRKLAVAGIADVSQARADRQRLEQSERRWRQMANSQPQLIWTCVADGSCDFLSQRWVEYTGIPEAEQLGSRWLAQVHPDDQAGLQGAWQAAVDTLSTFRVEFRIRRRDGVYRWFDTQAVPLLDEHGRLVQWIGSNTDINQRKQAEDSLRALNNTLEEKVAERTAQLERTRSDLQRILDAVPSMIGYWDRDLRNRFANHAYYDWFGVDPGTLPGKTLMELLGPQLFEANRSYIEGALAGEPQTFERLVGKRDSIARYLPDRVGDEVVGFLAVVTDVTELRAAMKAAQAASAAKSMFLANMSHEIRTPMNAVMNLCYLLEASELGADQRDLVGKMRMASRSLLGLINDVLDLSKIEAGHMGLSAETFALPALLNNAVQLMAPQARSKGLELRLDIGPTVPDYVRGDSLRISQVLGNLIGNAVKFTEHGSVVVRVHHEAQADGVCTLLFEVVDTGIGIPLAAQAQLFEPFIQADDSTTRRFGGSGLGLAIVKRLVDLMKGSLGVESDTGKGSRFWFRLHLRLESEATLTDGSSRTFKVLIADDSLAERDALAASARSLGWQVEAVSSGAEVIERVEDRRSAAGHFDALLIDWRMPDLDGLETLQELRRRFGGPPAPAVIVVTAYDRRELMDVPHSDLANAVLSKPVNAAALFDAVNAVSGDHLTQQPPGPMAFSRQLDGLRILLVDDSSINLEVGERVLAREGAAVVRATNGQEALDVLRASRETIDLVLMDVQMPVLDGNAATRRIRGELGLTRLPVIALTAGALLGERRLALESGMDAFISKPFEPQEMVSLICRMLGRQIQEQLTESALRDVPVIAGLRSEEVGRRLNGDWPLLRSLLGRMFDEFGSQWPGDADGLDAPQRHDLAQRAHKLRGVAGNIGADELCERATRLESAARANEPPQLAPLVAAIVDELDRLRIASATFLEQGGQRDSDDSHPRLDPQELQELMRLLEEQRLDALKCYERIKGGLRSALGGEQSDRLERAIQDLQFPEALKITASVQL